jgi:hypothetical protein
MASAQDYADWIVKNADKKGTPEFQTVAQAYQAARTQKPAQYDPTEGMSTFDKLAAGLGKSMVDTGRGLGQLVGLVPQKDIDDAAQRDKALMNTTAGVVGNVGGQVLQMALPGAGLAKVAPAVKAVTAARPFASAAAGAGAFAATQPVLTGDTRAGNAAQGAALGAAGQGVASLAGKAARGASDTLTPQVKALYQKALDAGIPVNLAQLSDSKFLKTLASAVEKMPFTGGVQSRNNQQAAFNRAVSKTFGENTDRITDDVYAAAKKRIGGQFEALTARNNLTADNTMLGRLAGVVDEANRFGADDTARAVQNSIDELLGKADANGVIPGRAYQSLDSKLGKLMKGGGEKAMYLGQVREVVREAMDQGISQADKAAWQQARGQYKNLKAIRDLVAKNPEGNISPALLAGRLNANEAGKETMAMGARGELGDLAKIGRQFVRDPVPDSGTAQRMMALGALGGGGYAFGVDPASLIGIGIGGATGGRMVNRLLNSPASGNYMVNGGNALMQMLAQGAKPAPLLLPAVVNALQQ